MIKRSNFFKLHIRGLFAFANDRIIRTLLGFTFCFCWINRLALLITGIVVNQGFWLRVLVITWTCFGMFFSHFASVTRLTHLLAAFSFNSLLRFRRLCFFVLLFVFFLVGFATRI